MKFEAITLESLLKESDAKRLVLPNFQRDFVWDVEKQKMLLASFLLHLPTGSLLTLKGSKHDFSAREVCFPNKTIPMDQCKYLLDGQQRFSSFKNIFTNLYQDDNPQEWQSVWNKLFNKLKYRFFLKISAGDFDFFGFENLQFNSRDFEEIEPAYLTECIEEIKLFVKDKDKYYHPGFNPTDDDGNYMNKAERRAIIIQQSTEHKLIPLYELFESNNNSLHVKVLRSIAIQQANFLEDKYSDDNSKVIEILSPVDDSIKSYIEKGDKTKIKTAWIRLSTIWSENVQHFLENRLESQISEISLSEDEVGKAFAIFEIINQPGTPLDEYDLTVAKAARNVQLPQLTNRLRDLIKKPINIPEAVTAHLHGTKPTVFDPITMNLVSDKAPVSDFKQRFLQILSLISFTIEKDEEINIKHVKREKILSLKEEQINAHYSHAVEVLIRAYAFMHYRCGIISIDKIPFKLMVLPIAYALIDNDIWNSKNKLDKIEYWYWSSIFGGYYQKHQNQRSYEDILSLNLYLKVGEDPFKSRKDRVFQNQEYSSKDILLMERPDFKIERSISSSILQYVLSKQPRDFVENETLRLNTWDIAKGKIIDYGGGDSMPLTIEDHHICPLFDKATLGESSSDLRARKDEILNSPLNRTYISQYANRKIRNFSPENYFNFVSDAAKFGHFIPMPIESKYKKRDDESIEKYYKRVLSDRFEEISTQLRNELNNLAEA